MKKVRLLSKKIIDEISALIGASFWDYPYEPGEGGLKPSFPSKAAMTEYMKSFVIAGMESGTFYSTDHGEGYIIITDTKGNHPNIKSIVKMAQRMKNALGGWGKAFDILALDYFLLTKTIFFPHFSPKPEAVQAGSNFDLTENSTSDKVFLC